MFEALGGRTLDSKSSDISSKRVSAYDNALIFVISLLHLLTVFPNKVYLIFSGFVSWKYLAQRKVLHSRHNLHNTLFHLYNSRMKAFLSHLIFCFVYRVSFEHIPYSLRFTFYSQLLVLTPLTKKNFWFLPFPFLSIYLFSPTTHRLKIIVMHSPYLAE